MRPGACSAKLGFLLILMACSSPPERREGAGAWVPEARGWVTDLAGVFTDARREALAERLAEYKEETSNEIAVLTVPDLRGEVIEKFSLRVANTWGVGDADLDNGVLVTVAPKDRKARIEIGYGLQKAIPDALAAKIMEEQMIPAFRKGDHMDGIEAGVEALMKAGRQ